MGKRWKLVFLWIIGSFLIFFGALIAGKIERGLGVSDAMFFSTLMISYLFILIGGLLWISIAASIKRS